MSTSVRAVAVLSASHFHELRQRGGNALAAVRPQLREAFAAAGVDDAQINEVVVRDTGTIALDGRVVDLAEYDLVAVEAFVPVPAA